MCHTLYRVAWPRMLTFRSRMQQTALNDDILREVFDYVAPHIDLDEYSDDAIRTGWTDLAHGALVCRGWTRSAQTALYARTIMIHLNDVQAKAKCAHPCAPVATLFVRTMRTCPHLRPLVRSLVLQVTVDLKKFSTKDVDWLLLLPPDGLRAFQCFWYPERVPFPSSVLQAPAVLTARHVHLHSDHAPVPLSSVMSLKAAKDLIIHVPALSVRSSRRKEKNSIDSGPPVERLTLHMCDSPGHYQCLAAFAPGLRSFTATGEWYRNKSIARPIGKAITRHLGRDVAELTLCTDWAGNWVNVLSTRGFRSVYPFLDDVAQRKPRLERLVAPPASYTEVFFQHLPPTLKTLEFVLQSRLPFPFERPLCDALVRLRDHKRPMAMKRIVFWSRREYPRDARHELDAQLREVCVASGITLCHKEWDDAKYGDRMSGSCACDGAWPDPMFAVNQSANDPTYYCCKCCCPEVGACFMSSSFIQSTLTYSTLQGGHTTA